MTLSHQLTGGQTSPYWLGILPIRCGLNFSWLTVTLCFHGLMSLSCLILQMRLYFFIRNCIRTAFEVGANRETTMVHRRHGTDNIGQRIIQLELRATRILTMGILPFCLLTIPLSGSSVCVFMSKQLNSATPLWIILLMVILRELFQLHLIYIPAVFIIQSREFQAAGWRFFRFKQPKSSTEHRFI